MTGLIALDRGERLAEGVGGMPERQELDAHHQTMRTLVREETGVRQSQSSDYAEFLSATDKQRSFNSINHDLH